MQQIYSYIVCRGVWNPPFLFFVHPLYQTTLFTKTYIPTLLQIMFFKNKHDPNLHNSFETTMFLTSKSYGGIKLVRNLENMVWVQFKCINRTQNEIIIFALMHNIRTHPFYFWYTLYTQTPFLTVKHINPPFYTFFQIFSNPPFLKCGLHTMAYVLYIGVGYLILFTSLQYFIRSSFLASSSLFYSCLPLILALAKGWDSIPMLPPYETKGATADVSYSFSMCVHV